MIFTAQYVNPGDRAFPSRFVSFAAPTKRWPPSMITLYRLV
jgi:hypothetical protein